MMYRKVPAPYSRIHMGISAIRKIFHGKSNFELAALFIGFTITNNVYAQNQCAQLLSDTQDGQHIESTPFEPTANMNAYRANLSAGRKLWDIATMGVLGELYDLTLNPINGRNAPVVNEAFKAEVEARTKKTLEDEVKPLNPRHRAIVDRIAKISDLTGHTKRVSVKNYSVGKETPELEQAIKNRFSLAYIKLVNWVYRLHNLEKNDPSSSAVMMDEIAEYALQGIGFEFNLVYDKWILERNLQVIAKVIDEYESTTDILKRREILRKLEVEMPLMPIAGVAVAIKVGDPRSPVELKRYFKNEVEDPLGIASVIEKDEFQLRHVMLYKTIEALPREQMVEIHAHTKIHIKAYMKLGFVDMGSIENPRYPGVEIHLLRATREEALKHIKSVLDGLE